MVKKDILEGETGDLCFTILFSVSQFILSAQKNPEFQDFVFDFAFLFPLKEIDSLSSDYSTKYRVFFNWYPPKKLKYVKPRLGESTLT